LVHHIRHQSPSTSPSVPFPARRKRVPQSAPHMAVCSVFCTRNPCVATGARCHLSTFSPASRATHTRPDCRLAATPGAALPVPQYHDRITRSRSAHCPTSQ
jgi:hypothetical protein